MGMNFSFPIDSSAPIPEKPTEMGIATSAFPPIKVDGGVEGSDDSEGDKLGSNDGSDVGLVENDGFKDGSDDG